MTKKEIRDKIKAAFLQHTSSSLEKYSNAIHKQMFNSNEWKSASHVLLYASLPDEVETDSLIYQALTEQKQVFLPKIQNKKMIFIEIQSIDDASDEGAFGIREPAEGLPQFDLSIKPSGSILVIVPGRAFDCGCNRIGRGGGYYDRFLSTAKTYGTDVFIMGVCFQFQIIESVPVFSIDISMHSVITETAQYR